MKKLYAFLAILAVPVILLTYGASSGSPGGKSGSPLDVNNCTQCHTGDAQTAEDWITTDIPDWGYTPGETYTITVTGMHEGVSLMGFEITAESSFGKVGEFALADTIRTQLTNGNRAVTHTSDGNTPDGDMNTWDMEWTAPSVGSPVVTFYAAINAADGSGNTTGDVIYLTTLEVIEASTSIGQDLLESTVRVYPNPATQYVNVETPDNARLEVINFLGQMMNIIEETDESTQLDVSAYDQGIYFVRISSEGQSVTKRVVVN
jgi:hypothetical protein